MNDDAIAASVRDLRTRLSELDREIVRLQGQRLTLVSALATLEGPGAGRNSVTDNQTHRQTHVAHWEDKKTSASGQHWVPGDSVAAAIRSTARDLIWGQKRAVDRREVLEEALRRGIPVGGKDPSKTVTRILTRSSQFTNTGTGYVMTDFHRRK